MKRLHLRIWGLDLIRSEPCTPEEALRRTADWRRVFGAAAEISYR